MEILSAHRRFGRFTSKAIRQLTAALAAVVLCVAAALPTAQGATEQATDEDAPLKANFLRNFIEFAHWPLEFARLNMCTLGDDQLGSALGHWPSQRIRGMQIELRRRTAVSELHRCNVVYISAAAANQLGQALAEIRERPVLVIADKDGAAQLGATISLHATPDGHLGFDVNYSAARRAGLRLDSRLMRLARRVH